MGDGLVRNKTWEPGAHLRKWLEKTKCQKMNNVNIFTIKLGWGFKKKSLEAILYIYSIMNHSHALQGQGQQ